MQNSKVSFWKDFGLGFKTYGKAIKIIFTSRLWMFFFFPLAINLAMFFGGIELKSMVADYLKTTVNELIFGQDVILKGVEQPSDGTLALFEEQLYCDFNPDINSQQDVNLNLLVEDVSGKAFRIEIPIALSVDTLELMDIDEDTVVYEIDLVDFDEANEAGVIVVDTAYTLLHSTLRIEFDFIKSEFWGSDFLEGFLEWFITIAFTILFFFVFAYFGGYIVLIVMSPILAYLSEKTEKIVSGNDYPFDLQQMMRDVVRGIMIAFRNLAIELGFMLGLFALSYFPVIGWILGFFGAVILFFISSYFYGFSFMDYSMERKRFNVKQSVRLIRKRKGVAVANGTIFSLALLIPLCGVSVAGFFAIVASVAASLAMIEVYKTEGIDGNSSAPSPEGLQDTPVEVDNKDMQILDETN